MSLPLAQNLKMNFPQAVITVISKKELAALWKHSRVDNILLCSSNSKELAILTKQLKKLAFDISILLATGEDVARAHFQADVPIRIGYDFWGRGHLLTHFIPTNGSPTALELTQNHMVNNYLNLLKLLLIKPRYVIPKISSRAGKNSAKHKQEFIGIAPGATFGPSKQWPLESFHKLVTIFLNKPKIKILFLGSKEDHLISRSVFEKLNLKLIINQMGKTNVNQLIGWISRCKVIVANDSGISHLANALGVPTVTLFGSSSPVWTRPLDPRSEVITLSLPCSPCFQPVCPLGHTYCLKKISVSRVLNSCIRIINGK